MFGSSSVFNQFRYHKSTSNSQMAIHSLKGAIQVKLDRHIALYGIIATALAFSLVPAEAVTPGPPPPPLIRLKPNLVITVMAVDPANPSHVIVDVKNVGAATAAASYTLAYSATTGARLAEVWTPSVGAGVTRRVHLYLQGKTGMNICVMADARTGIVESNENDNYRCNIEVG